MFAILHALGIFVADLFKSRCRLEAENLLLRSYFSRPQAWHFVPSDIGSKMCGGARMIVSFRDAWLRDFLVEDVRAK